MNQALYRKYRPNNFDEVYGQDPIIKVIKNSLINSNFSHAYLFCGPRGTGKTSVARLLAKAVNCQHRVKGNPDNKCDNCVLINESKALDILEIDAASHTQVDNIREVIIERANFAPTNLNYKVYIIDEAHMLSKSSFNALLKTLEEPPPHTVLILATTEVNKIPSTIISRCQRFDFKRINVEDLVNRLKHISKEENILIDDKALHSIAKLSEGGFRDAISLLDQLSVEGNKIGIEEVESLFGIADISSIEDLVFALSQKDRKTALQVIDKAIDKGTDIASLSKNIIEYLRKALIASIAGTESINVSEEAAVQLDKIVKVFPTENIIQTIEIFIESERLYRYAFLPELALEVSVVKATANNDVAENRKDRVTEGKSKPVNDAKPVKKENAGQWQQLLMEVKSKNNSIHAFLKVCDPEFDNESLCLYFPYKFHKERIEEAKNRRIVEEAIKRVYGKDYKITCVIRQSHSTSEKEKPKNDDLLKDALEIFGGEVVE